MRATIDVALGCATGAVEVGVTAAEQAGSCSGMASGICRLDLALPDVVHGGGGIEIGHLRHWGRRGARRGSGCGCRAASLDVARSRFDRATAAADSGNRGPVGFLGQGGVLQGPVSNDGWIPRLHAGMGDVRRGGKLHRGHKRAIAAPPRFVGPSGRTLLHRRTASRDGHVHAG